jgi:putative Ca2+/H+ antiporter (TMEM165/GDT1 family)
MEAIDLFLITFGVVFVGELGDKSQAIAFVAALSNHTKRFIVFLATALALIFVSGSTIYLTGFIPKSWLPGFITTGGVLLVTYGIYIIYSLHREDEEHDDAVYLSVSHGTLFVQQFALVTMSELGDKTQVASFGIAIANPNEHLVVFAGAALALTVVAGLTILAAKFIPDHWHTRVQIGGATSLILFGIYMLTS